MGSLCPSLSLCCSQFNYLLFRWNKKLRCYGGRKSKRGERNGKEKEREGGGQSEKYTQNRRWGKGVWWHIWWAPKKVIFIWKWLSHNLLLFVFSFFKSFLIQFNHFFILSLQIIKQQWITLFMFSNKSKVCNNISQICHISRLILTYMYHLWLSFFLPWPQKPLLPTLE